MAPNGTESGGTRGHRRARDADGRCRQGECGHHPGKLRQDVAAVPRPVLLFAVPISFGLLLVFVAYGPSWPVGFDFRGTLWEPARALLDGNSIYPAPTRDAVVVGNPAVYPPLFILVAVPLALVPVGAAAWLWLVILAGGVVVALWVLGVRDWRCYVLAVTSPVVVSGLYSGTSRCSCCAARARLEVSRPRADRRSRARSGHGREAVRRARARVASPDAPLPGRLGGRLRCRARPRRMGARRLRRAPRLPDAPSGPAGRLRGAEHLGLDRRLCARGVRVGRDRRGRLAGSPRGRCVGSYGGTTATGVRSQSSSPPASSRLRSSGRTTSRSSSSRSR